MLINFFTIAWRSLLKNKTASFINIAGLAVGLGTALIILLLVTEELSFDNFQVHAKDIYMLNKNQASAGGIITGHSTPGLAASEIKTNVPSGATTGTLDVKTPNGTLKSNVVFRVTK